MKSRPTSSANLKALIELAESGSPLAQFRLAEIYADIWDIHEDLEQSIDWYRKAAEQGYTQAFPRLAAQLRHMAHSKTGVTPEAIKWLKKAALHGCDQTAFWLSEMYCLNLPSMVRSKHEAGIQVPQRWLTEIPQSELKSFIWLNIGETLRYPDERGDPYVQKIRDDLISRLAPDDVVAAHSSIAKTLEEVDRHKNETRLRDDLEERNELLSVDPADL